MALMRMNFLSAHASSFQRCPACGQALPQPTPTRCPLCELDFGDDRTTGIDLTPFAVTYAQHSAGWRQMCEWIWFAGAERIKHLALMRSSAASRRFRSLNLLAGAFALALIQLAITGFHWSPATAAVEPSGSVTPRGQGWLHVAAAPRPLPYALPAEVKVDLWWNPMLGTMGAMLGFAAGWIALSLLLGLLRISSTAAHAPTFRKDGRLTAALQYSTAWTAVALISAMLYCLTPLARAGSLAAWRYVPPPEAFSVASAALAGLGGALWWFWLVRLGFTAPPTSRNRVAAVFLLGAPVLAAGLGAGWWFGLLALQRLVAQLLHLEF